MVWVETPSLSLSDPDDRRVPPSLDGLAPAALFRTSDHRHVLGLSMPSRGRPGMAGPLPPKLDATPFVSHTFRFSNTAAGNAVVSFDTLCGALGGICTVANSKVQPWASSIRLKKVTVWPSASSSSVQKVELFWEQGTSGQIRDSSIITDLPEGITVTKAVSFVPPAKSLASDWLATPANVFAINAPVGSIIDLSIDFTLANIYADGLQTVASATLGNIYYLALDGATANKYVPIGVPTTS